MGERNESPPRLPDELLSFCGPLFVFRTNRDQRGVDASWIGSCGLARLALTARNLAVCVTSIAASLVVARAASGPPADIDVRLGTTVEISSSRRYCWYPTVHRFPSGEILVTMRMSPDELHPEGEFSAYCLSRDGGASWSARIPMGAGGNIDAAYSQDPTPDGALISLSAGYGSPLPSPPGQERVFQVALTRYRRGGLEVTQVRDAVLRLHADAHMAPTQLFDFGTRDTSKLGMAPEVTPFGAIIEGLDGSLLTTVYYTEADGRRKDLVIARSGDGGRSWEEVGRVMSTTPPEREGGWVGPEGPDEAGLVRLADRRLFVLFRTGSDAYLGKSWSADDGRSWSRPVSSDFKGVAPHLRRLAIGVIACTTGRPGPVTVRFSLDGSGAAWTHATEIFRGPGTRYSDLIELEPGRLLVVYDSVPYGWHPIPTSDKTSRTSSSVRFSTFAPDPIVSGRRMRANLGLCAFGRTGGCILAGHTYPWGDP